MFFVHSDDIINTHYLWTYEINNYQISNVISYEIPYILIECVVVSVTLC